MERALEAMVEEHVLQAVIDALGRAQEVLRKEGLGARANGALRQEAESGTLPRRQARSSSTPARERIPQILREHGACTYQEIARQVPCSNSTVWRVVRDHLEPEGTVRRVHQTDKSGEMRTYYELAK